LNAQRAGDPPAPVGELEAFDIRLAGTAAAAEVCAAAGHRSGCVYHRARGAIALAGGSPSAHRDAHEL
jgi:hypothetical protein